MKLQFGLRRSTFLRGKVPQRQEDRMAGRRFRGMIGALIAGSMVFSSTGAIAAAAPAPTTQADPWAVLSAMSGGASAAAVCGAAAAAAAAAVQPAAGCVLPQVDVVAPAAQEPPPPQPIPPVAPESAGLGISPLLLALAAVAAGVALFLILHHKHHNNSPA